MRIKNSRIPVIIGIVGFSCFVLLYILRNSDLKRNGIIVNGVITGYSFPAKTAVMNFEYMFYFNGKRFSDNSSAGVQDPRQFIGRTFPIRYSPKTNRSEILITPRNFKKYGLKYPDTLNWVKPFLINGF